MLKIRLVIRGEVISGGVVAPPIITWLLDELIGDEEQNRKEVIGLEPLIKRP